MITIDNKKINFIDSYLINESKLKKILKLNNLMWEDFLEKVTQDFKSKILVERLFENNEMIEEEIFGNLREKLKKQIKLESNSLYVPIQEFVDLINFTIFTEVGNQLESSSKEYEIKKLSSVMSEITESDKLTSNENTFSEESIISNLKKITSEYTKNTEIKNGYFIITFD